MPSGFSAMVYIYYPGKKFPSLSVTGPHCALRCKHCNAKYLQHMIPVPTPEALIDFARKNEGEINGFLLSGGSTPDGKVPLQRFTKAVRWITENTDLIVNIHTGIIDREDIEYLEDMRPHHISFDVVGATETVREVLGTNRTAEDYLHALEVLDESSLNYSPHIIAGLHFGKILGEYTALKKIASLKRYSNLVLIVLIPTKGTPMENVNLDVPAITEFFKYMLDTIPPEKVVLGCMRPRSLLELEGICIEANCKGIVLPSLKSMKRIKDRGIKIIRKEMCCVF